MRHFGIFIPETTPETTPASHSVRSSEAHMVLRYYTRILEKGCRCLFDAFARINAAGDTPRLGRHGKEVAAFGVKPGCIE